MVIFKRPCIRCDKTFTPTGKYQRICEGCNNKRGNTNNNEKMKSLYFQSKEQLEQISSSATLSNWKVLSKAYEMGKKIWGSKFTRQRLAFDMEMPITTVLRCLSLDRATKRSMNRMNKGEISASKLSMICQTKSKTFQDEIVDLVIKNNYSTYQIKSLRVNSIADVTKEKHRLAIETGYSRQSSAADGFISWIERGKLFLLMRDSALTKPKLDKIKDELKDLNKRIEAYLE